MNDTGTGYSESYGLEQRKRTGTAYSFSTCKESGVLSPNRMLAYGDAVFWNKHDASGYGTSLFNCSSYFLPVTDLYRKRISQRHNGRWNAVCADAHVETFKENVLFGKNKYGPADEPIRRRWNRDNKPHWEDLIPPPWPGL